MHDPGGRSFRPLPPGTTGHALFDGPDACYRLELWRAWPEPPWYDRTVPENAYILFIGMNPSTADGDVDDPTIAIERAIADRLGFSRYLKMNLSPYRATDPSRLRWANVSLQPVGHDMRLLTRARAAEKVVVACGVPPGPLTGSDDRLFELLQWCGVDLWCLGTTGAGYPRHPLYMPAGAPLARWYGRVEALGPTHRFFAPDTETPVQAGAHWRVGDAWAMRAPKSRRLRDLVFYQVVDLADDGSPVTVPAGHLANRYADEINIWARRAAQ